MKTVIAAILGAGLLGYPPTAAAQKEAPRLRFDGLYILQPYADDSRMHSYLRVTESGDVYYRGTNSSAASVAGTWSDSWSKGPKGRYKLAGSAITIEVEGGSGTGECKGTIEDGGLALTCQWTWWEGGKYTFAALKFDRPHTWKDMGQYVQLQFEDEKGKTPAAPAAPASGVSPTATLPVQLTFGTATMDAGCAHTQLTPAPEPIVLPAGTAELAYQVKLNPEAYSMDVSVSMSALCETTHQRRCNTYAIVWGRPQNSGWTTVLTCGDGKPFKPGHYHLELVLNGAPVRQIPFEVK